LLDSFRWRRLLRGIVSAKGHSYVVPVGRKDKCVAQAGVIRFEGCFYGPGLNQPSIRELEGCVLASLKEEILSVATNEVARVNCPAWIESV
jgi:hypothetical protein